jgi:hypothetical protein
MPLRDSVLSYHLACTCLQWQSTGIPCAHAIAFLLSYGEHPQIHCEQFLTLKAYRKTYAHSIRAPDADISIQQSMHSESESASDPKKLLPPHARRAAGRPRKRRIRSGVEGPFGTKRPKTCSRCKGVGYCKSTCDASILKIEEPHVSGDLLLVFKRFIDDWHYRKARTRSGGDLGAPTIMVSEDEGHFCNFARFTGHFCKNPNLICLTSEKSQSLAIQGSET